MSNFQEWLQKKAGGEYYFYIKRLSANDTGATGAHQVGIYIPSAIVAELFPSIDTIEQQNPSVFLQATYASHSCDSSEARAIYYNNKFFGKTRNEKRITRWGPGSPLQDTENTGGLCILAFKHTPGVDSSNVDVWVCNNLKEENILETIIGEIIPGQSLFGPASEILGALAVMPKHNKRDYNIPENWKVYFPSGLEIIEFSADFYNQKSSNPDEQLIERRNVEYDLYLKIEEFHVLETIRKGFGTVDEFIKMANSVSNRRKSRAGKSLEIHLEKLFIEHGLKYFSTQCLTEQKNRPDFIFPSAEAYHDDNFPNDQLRMLAVKTTLKDRWRQICSEADKIKFIHLFTLQEGVSLYQFNEMKKQGVTLVVPFSLHKKYPEEIRHEIMTLGGFINEFIELYKGLAK